MNARSTMDQTHDEKKLADIEAELEPLTAKYNRLRAAMAPLWAARRKVLASMESQKDRDRRQKRAAEAAAYTASLRRAFVLATEGATHEEILAACKDQIGRRRRTVDDLVWAGARDIISNEEWDHPLIVPALKLHRGRGGLAAAVNAIAMPPDKIIALREKFEAAGFTVTLHDVRSGRAGDGGVTYQHLWLQSGDENPAFGSGGALAEYADRLQAGQVQ